MTTYRTGKSWGVTIVREGHGEPNPGNCGLVDDELVAVITNGDRELAERICALLNRDGTEPFGAKSDWALDNNPQLAEWLRRRAGGA